MSAERAFIANSFIELMQISHLAARETLRKDGKQIPEARMSVSHVLINKLSCFESHEGGNEFFISFPQTMLAKITGIIRLLWHHCEMLVPLPQSFHADKAENYHFLIRNSLITLK